MSGALWSTAELAKAMGARHFGKLPERVSGLSIDTRTLQPGDAFFAIRGDRFDGHDFVTQAMKAGAGLAVVAEGRLVAMGRTTMPFLVVEDVLEALRRLADASRARSTAQIIGVTGSVGKTTTKEMLRLALSSSGKVHASAASFNNHWGVPLTLALMPADSRYGVFEIGMNHAGEITPLVAMVRPHVAIITTIAPAHLGAFDDITGITRAKAEIFTGLLPGGTAVLYRDNDQYDLLRRLADEAGVSSVVTFGTSENCEFRLLSVTAEGAGSLVSAMVQGRAIEYGIGAPGEHIALNSLAVLAAVSLTGADLDRSAAMLAHFAAGKGRGERHSVSRPDGVLTVIDESYNANPASMRAALRVLASVEPAAGGRRIAVLGDMLELGQHSAELHAGLRDAVIESGAQQVHLAGAEMQALADALGDALPVSHHGDAASLGDMLAGELRGGDVVMLKASNGLKFNSVVARLVASRDPQGAGAR